MGTGGAALSPADTGRFLLFPSCACPAKCPTSEGRRDPAWPWREALGQQRGEIQGSQCSRCCSPTPARQAPVRVDVCVTPGAGLPGAQVFDKVDHLSEPRVSDGWQAQGVVPQSGTNSHWQVQLLGCLASEGRGRKRHLCPPGNVPGHHPGPGLPVARWPLSGRRMSRRFILCWSCLSTHGWGRGLVLTVCPPAAVYCPPFLSSVSRLFSRGPGGRGPLFSRSPALVPSAVRLRPWALA